MKLYANAEGVISLKPQLLPKLDAKDIADAPQAEVKKPEVSSELSGNNEYDNTPPVQFTYQGGLVIKNPVIYNIYLGDWSGADKQQLIASIEQYSSDILKSEWMNILSEYQYAGKGKYVKNFFIPNVDNELNEPDIHAILQNAIDNKVIPEDTGDINSYNIFMIYLDEKTGINDSGLEIYICQPDNDNAFGYHSTFVSRNSKNIFYCIIPALTDTCLDYSCKGGACSLKLSDTQIDRITQVSSHELAEVITNPNEAGYFDVKSGNEIGDICNAKTAKIKIGENTWQVQKQYSKSQDDASNGNVKCVGGMSATGVKPDSKAAQFVSSNSMFVAQAAYVVGVLGIVYMLYKIGKKKVVVAI